jgi:MFS family permease
MLESSTDVTLRPAERRRAQQLMIAEGMVWTVMYVCILGVPLTGWALALGATAWQIGLLTTIPALMRLAQIVAPRLMRPGQGRKRMALLGLVGARVFNLPIMLLPLVAWAAPGWNPALFGVLLGIVTVYNALDAIGVVGWMSWATDVVPLAERGRYWARRGMLAGLVNLLAAPIVGWVLDMGRGWSAGPTWAGQPHPLVFALVFAVGTAAGAITAWLLGQTPHAPAAVTPAPGEGLLRPIRRAMSDPTLRRYITARTTWSFGVWLALPFVNVYWLKTLGLDFTTVTLLTAGQTLLNLASLTMWGRAVDRWGCRPIVILSTALRATSLALLAVTTTGTPWLWPLLLGQVALAGLGDGGLQLSVSTLLMKLTPRADPAYFAAFNTITGLTAALGPLLASALLAWIGSRLITVGSLTISPLQFFFMAAAVIGWGSLLLLRGFAEPRETEAPAPASEPVPA